MTEPDGRAVCIPCIDEHDVPILRETVEDEPVESATGWLATPWALIRSPAATLTAASQRQGVTSLVHAWGWLALSYLAWFCWMLYLEPATLEPSLEQVLGAGFSTDPFDLLVHQGFLLAFPALAFFRLALGVLLILAAASVIGIRGEHRPALVHVYATSQAAFLLTLIPTFVGPLLASFVWALLLVTGTRRWTGHHLGKSLLLVLPVGTLQLILGPAPLG